MIRRRPSSPCTDALFPYTALVLSAAASNLPCHHRTVAHLICGKPVHIRHGTLADGHAAGSGTRHRRRSRPLPRFPSSRAGPHRDRHRLRDDCLVSGRFAGWPGTYRNGSRRWPRAGGIVSGWSSHLIIVPIVLPLLAGSAMLLFEERSRSLKAGINLAASLALVATTIPFLHMAGSDGPQSVYLLGNWPAPFGIVLEIGRAHV